MLSVTPTSLSACQIVSCFVLRCFAALFLPVRECRLCLSIVFPFQSDLAEPADIAVSRQRGWWRNSQAGRRRQGAAAGLSPPLFWPAHDTANCRARLPRVDRPCVDRPKKPQAQPGLGLHRTRGFPARGRKNPAAQPDANCWAKTARPAACAVSASANGGGAVGLGLASGGAGPAEGAAPPRSQQSFSGRRALGVVWDRGLLIWAFFT